MDLPTFSWLAVWCKRHSMTLGDSWHADRQYVKKYKFFQSYQTLCTVSQVSKKTSVWKSGSILTPIFTMTDWFQWFSHFFSLTQALHSRVVEIIKIKLMCFHIHFVYFFKIFFWWSYCSTVRTTYLAREPLVRSKWSELTVVDYEVVPSHLRGDHRNNHFCVLFIPQYIELRVKTKKQKIFGAGYI